MKRNPSRTGPGNRPARQEPRCTHRNLGRGRGGTCRYGPRSTNPSTRPLASLMSSVLGGILELADTSIRRLSTGLKNTHLLGDGSHKPASTLPDLEFHRKDNNLTQTHPRQLTENNEESQLIADKQE